MSDRLKAYRVHIILIAISLIMMYPVIWWIGASLKNNSELSSPSIFPAHLHWDNFSKGWNAIPEHTFSIFYMNSFELTFSVVLVSIFSTSIVAFGFARLDFPLRQFWFGVLLFTLMLPGQVLLIPQYTLYHYLNWINTYLPFIVPHALGIANPFFIFLMVQFIKGIPREMDEAAKIDGCSWFGIYWRIVLPLTVPAVFTVAIYAFLWNWDDFMGQLIYINSVDKYTVGLALRMFIDSDSANQWGQMLAMSLLSIVPSVIIFFCSQRYLVEGISTTGLKS